MPHVLIAGAGYVGQPLARRLLSEGHRVTALRRRPPAHDPGGPAWRAADITRPATLRDLPDGLDAVVCAVAPGARDEQAYRQVYVDGVGHLLRAVAGRELTFLLVSSTGVYGEDGGAWVDEGTPPAPATPTGRVLLEAEEQVLAQRPDACAVRFSGIYGPGRTWLLERVRSGRPVQADPPAYTNRIHRDDTVGVLAHLLARAAAGAAPPPRLVASDDDPAPLAEVAAWLAERLGVPPPPHAPADPHAPRNKRCRNALLKSLGYVFVHPGYREGYAGMTA